MFVSHGETVFVLGLDPGGANAFGWAVLVGAFDSARFVAGGVCTGARAAIDEATLRLDEHPAAVGIDAPLFWSCSRDRYADVFVRTLVCRKDGRGGTVNHINSLRGACLVEGAMAAHLARHRWATARITEAHPKALLAISTEVEMFASLPSIQGDGHHIRDAALGALTALAMIEQRANWQDLAALEPDPLYPLGVKAEYWFPQD